MQFKHDPWPPHPSDADEASGWPTARELDLARERIEFGPAGDVDARGHITSRGHTCVPCLKRTVSVWLRLYERVQRDELGGEYDGLRSTRSQP